MTRVSRMRVLLAVVLLPLACAPAEDAPATAFPGGTLVDLTHAYDSTTVYWPTASGFELDVDFKGMTDGG
ncbi:MAG: hypothetical protein R3284_06665, partial [Rubricoccaceae bacterium]|nr:hypothetical protein [Rubricoccaceae bacterium]